MSTTYAVKDSATMLRRNLLHIRRYPSLSIMLVAQPILFLLLFVYVFGATLGNGLGSAAADGATGRQAYIGFVTPTILLITITTANPVLMTAPSTCPVSTDTRAMSIVRNRAMIPVVMSVAVEIAVPRATLATVMIRMPGTMKTR